MRSGMSFDAISRSRSVIKFASFQICSSAAFTSSISFVCVGITTSDSSVVSGCTCSSSTSSATDHRFVQDAPPPAALMK